MFARLVIACSFALALCTGMVAQTNASQPLPYPTPVAPATYEQASVHQVPAEPMVPLESFTSESGWLAQWQADHQRRAATDGWIQTDRPSFTLSDSTVPKGWIQQETGYLYTYAHEGYFSEMTRDVHSLPQLNFRWGFTDWAELRVGWGGVNLFHVDYEHSNTYNFQQTANLEVGAKFQATRQNGWIPQSAFVVSAFLPTGDQIVMWPYTTRNDQVMPALDYIYTWTLTERFSIGGSSGAVIGNIDGFDVQQYFQSVIGRFHCSPTFSMFCEFYGTYDRRYWFSDDYYDWSPFFDTGIQWRPLANLQLDWRIGTPLGGSYQMDGVFTGVGASFRY